MDTATITPKQRDAILALEEGHFLDLKSCDVKPGKLTEAVSAFANTSGGELYVGIDEIDPKIRMRRWRGFARIEDANAHIQEVEKLAPLARHYAASFLTCPGEDGFVLLVQVFKTKDILLASDGQAYIRRSAQRLAVKGEDAIARLRMDKGIVSFEDQTANAPKTDITNSIVTLEFLINVIPTAEPEAWLTKQQLIVGDKPTVAGCLLFAEEPQAVLPKRSAVKLFRYKTDADVGERDTLAFDPLTVEGDTYSLIYRTVEQTKKVVEDVKRLGHHGLEEVSYPHETLHEILTNAVLHRDYSIAADIQVRVFDNRVEVESPGRLPGHVTQRNILTEQFARNPKLVRLVNKFPNPPNKDVGEGLNTAFDAMRRLRLKDPEIVERDNSVLVLIRHQKLASPEEAVMEFLETNEEITNRAGRQKTGIKSENSMKNVFIRMHRKAMIEPVPDKKGFASAWRRKR
ncbi:MAG: putative DNA binding domain-containing protein [Lentisphaerae bacterium]|nr:putative DNA binding domain-containing protein [Lentisphaerota bacterium]